MKRERKRTPAASARRDKQTPRVRLSPRWWLPLSFAISLLVHLLMLPLVSRVLQPSPVAPYDQGHTGPVVVQLARAQETGNAKAPIPRQRETPPPTHEAIRSTPPPPPERARPVKVAEAKEPPVKAPLVPGTPTPQPTPPPKLVVVTRPTPIAPTQTTGQFADRVPVPILKGSLTGRHDPEPIPPRLVAVPEATPSPLPPRVADAEGGRAGGGAVPADTSKPVLNSQFAVGTGGGSGGGESPSEGAGQGAGSGAGSGNGLGITRGIPFGDITGLSNGNPNGGGGRGGGPGGAFGARYGGGRFTLRRVSSGGGPPVHIVYVIDTSGSMEDGNKIGKARDALKKALDELRPEDSFNIVEFSDSAKLFSPSMRSGTSSNISAGSLAVDLIQPTGATNLSAALELALSLPGITHVFVMSDGEPTEGITDFDKLVEFARDRNAGHARIITLALGLGEKFKGMQLLRDLANENGGRFDYVNLARN